MKESYIEGPTTHDDPESCDGKPQGCGRSVDRGRCRLGIELRNQTFRSPTLLTEAEGNMSPGGKVSRGSDLRSRRPHARTETPCTRTGMSSACPLQVAGQDASERPEAVTR
jgi:RNA-directed DNA polymerase